MTATVTGMSTPDRIWVKPISIPISVTTNNTLSHHHINNSLKHPTFTPTSTSTSTSPSRRIWIPLSRTRLFPSLSFLVPSSSSSSCSHLLLLFLFLFLFSLLFLPLLPTIDAACSCTPSPSPPTCPSACSRCAVSGSIESTCNCDPGCDKHCSSGYEEVSEGGCSFLWLWPKRRCYRTEYYSTYTCTECPPGKYGSACQYTCPGTSGNTICSGNGWCSFGVIGSGLCYCNADAAGYACQYTRAGTCSGRGSPQYSGACACDKGYTGTNCQNCDVNYFRVNGQCVYCEAAVTCSGYGTCQSDATCKCREGFTGSDCKACAANYFAWPTCKKCIDSETCSGRGICDMTGNCICNNPFIGTNCNQCPSNLYGPQCDACPTYSTNPPSAACSGLGTCADGFTGSGTCTCTAGFGGADCADPFVTIITPQNGPSNGVFDVTLQGNLFGVDGGVVILSDPSNPAYTKQLSYSSYSSSTITAQMPVSELTSRPLAINVKNGNRISATTLRFTYDLPTIIRLVPAALPTTGGTISIQGTSLGLRSFQGKQAQVKLDNTVLSIEGWDDVFGRSAKVQIPAGVGSGKQLRITTHTGDSVAISYAYEVPVVISAITDPPPNVQPTTGGLNVLITGTNFGTPQLNPSSPPTVTIGGAPCPLVSSSQYSNTEIRCTAPAGRGSSQPVIVTVASQSSVAANVFHYAPPTVVAVSGCTPVASDPSATGDCPTTGTGPNSAIIYLTITGTNFGASATGLTVTVGNSFNCAGVTTIDPHTKIKCTLPPGSGVNLPVKVARDTQVGSKDKILSYAGPYILPNSLERLAPTVQARSTSVTSATTSGGDTVRFEGKSFGTNINVITVTYGSNDHPNMFPCAVQTVSDTSITCKTGGGEGANLHFRVMVGIVASNVGTDSYNYPSPSITSGTLRPSSATTGSNKLTGVMTQGEELSFDGTNFGSQRGRNLQVTYGPVSDPTTYICAVVTNKTTDTKVTCTTAPGDGGDYIFRVVVGPGSVPALGSDRFTYPTAPKVLSVDCPNACVLSSGTVNRCPTDALQLVSRQPAILTVVGANFGANGAIVTVGGKPCFNTKHDTQTPDSKIYCTLPPGTGINLNVVVNQGPLYSVGKPAVSYMEPEITAVKGCRNSGADTVDCERAGGTLITVLGKAFGESLAKVIIGGVPCPGAAGGAVDHCPNDPHGCVTCYTPKGTALSQPVLLIQNHGIISGSLTSTVPVRSLSYRQCQPGTYAPSNTVTCKQCEPGTFTDVEGADSCGLCPPGTFSVAGAPKCTSCPVGTYQSLPGQSSCTQCPPGSSQSAMGQIACNPCTPGFYAFAYASPACTPCSAGTSQPAFNATSCVPCDVGFATEDVGSRYCKPCTVGYVASAPGQIRCQACPINTYSNDVAQTKCQPCESGRHTRGATASKFCEPCLAGTYLDYSSANNTGLCVSCPAGYSSGPGASRCDACAAGKFSEKVGSDSCQPCATGTFSSQGAISCTACAPGKSQPAPGKAQCDDCDMGKVQAASGQSACTACPGGRYAGARGLQICSDCAPGTYSEESGLGSCTACAAGRYSSGGAMRCEDCPAGQYYNGTGATACVLCEAGTYFAGTGATACTPCDHGKYQISTGQIQCQLCSAGTYSRSGQGQCTPAEPGTYQPETGRNDTRPCPVGTSSPISGAVQCAACPDGKYSDAEGLPNCKLCPAGQWAIQNGGGVGVTICNNCSVGYFTPDMGYPECLPCTPGRWTNVNGTSVCSECSPGTVQPSENATSCIQCPVGQYQDLSQQTACSDCPPGKYSNQTGLSTCVQCAPGYVQTAYGQTSCTACGVGFFQNSPGQARCISCEPGRFGNVTGLATCSPCPEGYFTSTYGNTVCEGCPRGTSNPSRGLSACRDCAFGKFNNLTTQAECTPCPAGEHQDRQGAQQCVPCGVGRFAPSTGYTDCEACPTGRYSNDIHAQTCYACPPGRWQDAVGSTSCKETPAGSFSAAEAVKYSQCATSTIAPVPGLDRCIACDTFAVSNDDMTKCLCSAGYFQERDIYSHADTGNTADPGTATGSGTGSESGNQTMNGNSTISTSGKWNATSSNSSSSGGYMPSSTGGALTSSTGGNMPANNTSVITTSVPANGNNSIITGGANNGTNSSVPSSTSSPTSPSSTGPSYIPPSASVTALQCISCPRGANCTTEGVTYDTLTTSRGYWRNTTDERYALNFYKCLVTAHCTGGRNSSCGGNRDGVICAICLPGYRSTTGLADCTECPSKARSVAASFFIILAFFIVLVCMYYIVLRTDRPLMKNQADRDAGVKEWDAYNFMVDTPTSEGAPNLNNTPVISTESRSRPNFTYKMKIMLSFLQISTNMSFFVDVPWPKHYVEFIRAFTFVNLDFVPWQSIGCVSLFDFFDKFLIITIAPIIILLLIYLCYLLPMYYLDRRDMSDDAGFRLARKRSRRKFWKLVLFTTFLIYPTVSTTIFSFLNCKLINDEWYLLQDFTIRCYSPKWNSYLAADIIMMILYPIGIPIFLFYLLNRYRHRLMEPGVRVQLGFLFEAYQSNLWWFELVDMLHKLCMTSLLRFFPPEMQMGAGMMVLTLYTIVLLCAKPYVRKADDRLHLFTQVELYLLVFMGYILYRTDTAHADNLTDILLSVILIILTIGVMLMFVAMMITNVRKMWREHQRKKMLKNSFVADPSKVLSSSGRSSRPSARTTHVAHPDALSKDDIVPAETNGETGDEPTPESSAVAGANHETGSYQESNVGSFPNQYGVSLEPGTSGMFPPRGTRQHMPSSSSSISDRSQVAGLPNSSGSYPAVSPRHSSHHRAGSQSSHHARTNTIIAAPIDHREHADGTYSNNPAIRTMRISEQMEMEANKHMSQPSSNSTSPGLAHRRIHSKASPPTTYRSPQFHHSRGNSTISNATMYSSPAMMSSPAFQSPSYNPQFHSPAAALRTPMALPPAMPDADVEEPEVLSVDVVMPNQISRGHAESQSEGEGSGQHNGYGRSLMRRE